MFFLDLDLLDFGSLADLDDLGSFADLLDLPVCLWMSNDDNMSWKSIIDIQWRLQLKLTCWTFKSQECRWTECWERYRAKSWRRSIVCLEFAFEAIFVWFFWIETPETASISFRFGRFTEVHSSLFTNSRFHPFCHRANAGIYTGPPRLVAPCAKAHYTNLNNRFLHASFARYFLTKNQGSTCSTKLLIRLQVALIE